MCAVIPMLFPPAHIRIEVMFEFVSAKMTQTNQPLNSLIVLFFVL